MFTQKEVNSIDLEYFCIIQLGGYAVTIKSKNTRHCWHIVSQSYKTHSSCQVYHTHQENTPYHRHGNAGLGHPDCAGTRSCLHGVLAVHFEPCA